MNHKLAERISALAFLKENHGNLSLTARQLGIDRRTLRKWRTELSNDPRTRRVVERAAEDLASLEEANARAAIEEIAARLDEQAEQVRLRDLIHLKDSSIRNYRLLTDKSTENVAVATISADAAPIEYAKLLKQKEPSLTLDQVEECLMIAIEPGKPLAEVSEEQVRVAMKHLREIAGMFQGHV